ncbi:MAG: hypothetical protein ACP5C4_03895 [Methanomicrobiales archaeon]
MRCQNEPAGFLPPLGNVSGSCSIPAEIMYTVSTGSSFFGQPRLFDRTG